jgi:hypothetical protein
VAGTEKTEITIETDEVAIVRRRRFVTRWWCEACGRETNFSSLEPETTRQGLHIRDADKRRPMVCMESLLKTTQSVFKKQSQSKLEEK